MFDTIIVQPLYNLLIAIYGILPGHDLGVSLILFTALIRLAMWPLLKKQLHQSKVMRDLQPELAKVKKAAAGDRQKEGRLMMELYKEKGISPFGTIGLTLVQLPLFIGVFQAARNLTEQTDKISDFTYSFVERIPYIQQVVAGSEEFNFISFGFIDLSKKAFSDGAIYIPILLIAVAATVFQYLQSKQLLPQSKEKKKLRDILRASAASGKQPAQEDMSAAMSSSMLFLMPILTMLFAIAAQGAMVMYLLASSLIGILQQTIIFRQDTEEMEEKAEVISVKSVPESQATETVETEDVETATSITKEKALPKKKQKRGKVTTTTRIITPSTNTSQKKSKSARSKKKRKKR